MTLFDVGLTVGYATLWLAYFALDYRHKASNEVLRLLADGAERSVPMISTEARLMRGPLYSVVRQMVRDGLLTERQLDDGDRTRWYYRVYRKS